MKWSLNTPTRDTGVSRLDRTFKLVPWNTPAVYEGPFTPQGFGTDSGFSVLYNRFTQHINYGNPSEYNIINNVDAYSYFKLKSLSFNDCVSSPDMVLAPFSAGRLYMTNDIMDIVCNIAGHDFISSRVQTPSGINPRGAQAGIYITDASDDRYTSLLQASSHGYIRIYDIFDLTANFPASATPNLPTGQSTVTMGQPGFILNAIDGAGGLGLQYVFHVSQVTAGAGTAINIVLEKIVPPGTSSQVIVLGTFNLAVTSFTLPSIQQALDSGWYCSIAPQGPCSFTMDVINASINM